MRSLVAPLWKFGGQLSARSSDAARKGFLGDWQRWTRAERVVVIIVVAVISLAAAILPLV